MADAEWRPVEAEAFEDDDRDDLALATVTVDAESDLAAELLLDPLPHLVKHFAWVTDDWTVSLERVNADVRVGLGPRKLVAIWVAVRPLRRVCGVVYRVPPP